MRNTTTSARSVSLPGRLLASTREQLVVAAERLIAERGLDGVSLREISVQAGQANNNAVQYHFGDKQRLVEAVFGYRLPRIDRRREGLLQRAEDVDALNEPRVLAGVMLLPLAEEAADPASRYVSFLAQLQLYPSEKHPWQWLDQSVGTTARRTLQMLAQVLKQRHPDMPEAIRENRIRTLGSHYLHILADWERARQGGNDWSARLGFAEFVSDLLDVATSILNTSVSDHTAGLAGDPYAAVDVAVFGPVSPRVTRRSKKPGEAAKRFSDGFAADVYGQAAAGKSKIEDAR